MSTRLQRAQAAMRRSRAAMTGDILHQVRGLWGRSTSDAYRRLWLRSMADKLIRIDRILDGRPTKPTLYD